MTPLGALATIGRIVFIGRLDFHVLIARRALQLDAAKRALRIEDGFLQYRHFK